MGGQHELCNHSHANCLAGSLGHGLMGRRKRRHKRTTLRNRSQVPSLRKMPSGLRVARSPTQRPCLRATGNSQRSGRTKPYAKAALDFRRLRAADLQRGLRLARSLSWRQGLRYSEISRSDQAGQQRRLTPGSEVASGLPVFRRSL